MIAPLLNEHLEPVARRYRRLQLWRGLAICWALAGLLAVALGAFGLDYRIAVPLVGFLGFAAALWMGLGCLSAKSDAHWLALQIEQQHPELKTVLLAALEQKPDADGQFSFLQQRVIAEAVVHGRNLGWADAFPARKLALAHVAHLGAFAFFVAALMGLRTNSIAVAQEAAAAKAALDSVSVTPGDTQVERGNSLVVLAKFEGRLPPGATLVLGAGTNVTRTIALTKALDDPVFGGTVPEVNEDFSYRVEFAGQRTKEFSVKVFEHPKLERADAKIQFPAYTQLQEKTIEDTRRVSAVEGSTLGYTLQLNKPVKSARLVPRRQDGEVIPLTADAAKPFATLANFPLVTSATYALELVDADGRSNKVSAQFVFDALRNRVPELKLLAPRGDQRVSALQEIRFEAEAWDDFGLRGYGIAWSLGGAEPTLLQLGEGVPAKEKRQFSHLLRLEELGAAPDQLVAWFVWADDVGPDGELRRNASDMFFAEVRPFEEIFRQGEGGGEEEGGQPPGGQQSGAQQMGKLAELQKQIINATWKLRRQQGTALPISKISLPAKPAAKTPASFE
jgi:putative Ca2+/H+ antiporter (TMEM165/GDT1 family)